MSVAVEATAPADELLFEIIDGQRVELAPMGARETLLANYLAIFINSFTINSIGVACVEMLFDLQIGRNRRPDVALERYDRWPRHRTLPPGEAWSVIPNLAVEVVSPSNTVEEVLEKLADYFRAGVQIVWAQQRQVYVYTSPKDVQVLDRNDALEGGEVMPGFTLSLAKLFETEPAAG